MTSPESSRKRDLNRETLILNLDDDDGPRKKPRNDPPNAGCEDKATSEEDLDASPTTKNVNGKNDGTGGETTSEETTKEPEGPQTKTGTGDDLTPEPQTFTKGKVIVPRLTQTEKDTLEKAKVDALEFISSKGGKPQAECFAHYTGYLQNTLFPQMKKASCWDDLENCYATVGQLVTLEQALSNPPVLQKLQTDINAYKMEQEEQLKKFVTMDTLSAKTDTLASKADLNGVLKDFASYDFVDEQIALSDNNAAYRFATKKSIDQIKKARKIEGLSEKNGGAPGPMDYKDIICDEVNKKLQSMLPGDALSVKEAIDALNKDSMVTTLVDVLKEHIGNEASDLYDQLLAMTRKLISNSNRENDKKKNFATKEDKLDEATKTEITSIVDKRVNQAMEDVIKMAQNKLDNATEDKKTEITNIVNQRVNELDNATEAKKNEITNFVNQRVKEAVEHATKVAQNKAANTIRDLQNEIDTANSLIDNFRRWDGVATTRTTDLENACKKAVGTLNEVENGLSNLPASNLPATRKTNRRTGK